jgi:ElaB/YqjD/DUF883 family membrane-anchored ribosome-binding protein
MSQRPKTFSQAIDDLEDQQAEQGNGHEFRSRLEREVHRMEEMLERMKPHLDDIGGKVGEEAHKARRRVEHEVKKNPMAAIGIVGLIAFILGFIFAMRRRD